QYQDGQAQSLSALGSRAATMAAGQWAELPTLGMVAAFTGTAGASGIINTYAMNMVRDPVGQCSYYLGSDHGGRSEQFWPNSSYRFVRYCERTNTWTVMPN